MGNCYSLIKPSPLALQALIINELIAIVMVNTVSTCINGYQGQSIIHL